MTRNKLELIPQLERLQAMTDDDGEIWDLSPNDRMAIRWALAEITKAASQTAEERMRCHDAEAEMAALEIVHDRQRLLSKA